MVRSMAIRRITTLALTAGILLGCQQTTPPSSGASAAPTASTAPPATQAKRTPADIHHMMSRLAFGPRPGDVQAIQKQGVTAWFEDQLTNRSDPSGDAAKQRYASVLVPPSELRAALKEVKEDMVDLDMNKAERRMMKRKVMQTITRGPQAAQLARHIESSRQVREVLTDFWANHFNVYARKGAVKFFMADYVENTLRSGALGRFEDLLIATAKSPAMLVYLDNVASVKPKPGGNAKRRQRGLNENYARELLELHTLGVDGGYTQDDVIAVARILTGWSVQRPREGEPVFVFRAGQHDTGEKTVLGKKFPAGGGEAEGITLLKMLAAHPATARRVAKKLCERFVADAAPAACVKALEASFIASKGDIAQVMRTLVALPDFWSAANRGGKVKTPIEYVVSAVRALDGKSDGSNKLANVLARMGQPVFEQPIPTGYPEAASYWTSSGMMLNRFNFAVRLAAKGAPGVDIDLDRVMPLPDDADALVGVVNDKLLGGAASKQTKEAIRSELVKVQDADKARRIAIGMALGSPEFQAQ